MKLLFFQNLNERKTKLFHFRGKIGWSWDRPWFRFEICSGPALSFRMENDNEDGAQMSFGAALLSVYLTFYRFSWPLLKRDREYGFYVHDWGLWAFFGRKRWESSSSDPWYYHITVFPLDLLFGKTEHFERELIKNHDPVGFEFRGKSYQMDKIAIYRSFWFRPRIPFSIYRKEILTMRLDIKSPPKHSGKGENSWDCGDDATYGCSCQYKGPKPTWQNSEQVFEWCVREYCADTMKYILKYGRASDDKWPDGSQGFKYLGRIHDPKGAKEESLACVHP